MADDQPGRSDHIGVGVGEYLEEFVRGGQRLFIFLHTIEIIHGCPEDDRRLLVLREGIGKLQRTANNLPLDHIHALRRDGTKMISVCVDRRVAGFGGFFVGRVAIRSLLEFHGCCAEPLVCQQQIRQMVVDGRRFGVHGERGQKLPIPVQRLFEIRRLLFSMLRVLVGGVIMIRQVRQIDFQVTQDFRTVARFEILPVFGLQAVVRGEFLFGVKDQTGEPAGGLNFDNPHMEVRRHLVERITGYEGVVGCTGVGVAALIEVEFAKIAVYPVLVTALPVA